MRAVCADVLLCHMPQTVTRQAVPVSHETGEAVALAKRSVHWQHTVVQALLVLVASGGGVCVGG